MELSTELLRILNDNEEPLSKRIRLAKNVFISSRISAETKDRMVESKEERALKWLCGLPENKEARAALQRCLCSDRVKNYKYLYISPATRTSVILKLCETLMHQELFPEEKELFLESSLCLLDVPIFKQHFNRLVCDYTALIGALLKCLSSFKSKSFHDICVKVVDNLKSYSHKFYLNDEFRRCFHEHVLCPLSQLLENEESNSKLRGLSPVLYKCIIMTLYPKKRLERDYEVMDQLFDGLLKEQSIEIENGILIFQQIHHACSALTPDELFSLISVVFKSFIRSCRKDTKRQCQMFIIFCNMLGIKPSIQNGLPTFSNNLDLNSMNDVEFSKKKLPYYSIKTALNVFIMENVDINVDVAGFSFLKWLQSLCQFIVSSEETIKEPVIVLLTALSDLDPNILDSHNVKVIGPTMFNRSEKTRRENKQARSSYVNFLKSLLRSSLKLHRIQKLASRLLSSAKEQLTVDSIGSKLTAEDVLPNEFCSDFGNSLQLLVATQAMAMLKTLTFHLLEDCVQPMEEGKMDSSVILMLQLTTRLINEFLLGYRAVDPNIPKSKMEKFVASMSDLGNAIGRLGKVLLLGKHNPVTMGAFLELSHCWGDLELLLVFYQPDDPSALTEFPQLPSSCRSWNRGNLTATDFSGLHPHLSEGEWSHLVERIVNFGDDHCKKKLNELVVQKLRTVRLFEADMRSDKALSCVRYLISKASDSPSSLAVISDSIDIVAQLLDLGEIVKLSELIVAEHSSGNASLLKAVNGNAAIVPIITLTVLKEIGKKAFKNYYDLHKPRKRKHSEGDTMCMKFETPKTKGTQLSSSLFAAVDETISAVVEEHSGIKANENLLRHSSDSASLLPTKLALSLYEFFADQSVEAESDTEEPLAIDVSALSNLLGLLSSLPLSHLSESSRAVVTMCLFGLIIALRENEDNPEGNRAEAAVMEVILLAIRSDMVFKELVNYVDIGKFLTWYVCRERSLDSSHKAVMKLKCLQEHLMERLVRIGVSSPVGFEMLKQVIRAMKEEVKKENAQVDLICTISSLLMASFAQKCAKSSIKPGTKKVYLKYYKMLAASLIKNVNFDHLNINRQKLECFSLLLQNFISIKSQKRLAMAAENMEGLVSMVKTRFDPKVKHEKVQVEAVLSTKETFTELKSFSSCCFHFMDMLLSHRVQLKSYLSPTFAWDIWQILISAPDSSLDDQEAFSKTVKTLLNSSNKKEFMLLMNNLLDKLRDVDPDNPDSLVISHYMLFWRILVQCPLNKGVSDCRHQAVKDALPVFLSMICSWENLAENRKLIASMISILEFEHVLLKCGKISLHHQILDLVFESISIVPLSDIFGDLPSSSATSNQDEIMQNLKEFHKVFVACTNCLLELVVHHIDHLVDRLPSFLQCLSKLFKAAVTHGNIEYSSVGGLQGGRLSENLLVMTDCASNLEWITNALIKFKKDFSRVSPYFIANAVQSFERKPIHPAVKSHLHNCIYGFIKMCDTNGLAYLHHALPPGPKEIFKTLLDNYKKYYRFKGKI